MYYILDYATQGGIIGPEFPQIQKMLPGYDFKASNSIYNLSSSVDEIIDIPINLNEFVLHKKAKPTDILSCVFLSPSGLIVSDRLKNVLNEFSLPAHKYFPIVIYQEGRVLKNYFWLQMKTDFLEAIDYRKSSFYVTKNFGKKIRSIDIHSCKEYFIKNDELKRLNPNETLAIWAETIWLIDRVKDDLFTLGVPFDGNFYASSELATRIRIEGFTGFLLKKAELFSN